MTSLRIDGVSKRFQGVAALSDVHLEANPGEVLGLVGPNGAGKTTLVNVITGYIRPDGGTVWLGDQRLSGRRAEAVACSGVARTYQHLRLIDEMSVRDNVLVGRHQHHHVRPWLLRARRADTRAQRIATDRVLEELELDDVADEPVNNLAYGVRRRVEIARTLALEPRVLLLDEPTAGMTSADAHQIGELVRRTSRTGIAVLLIEHNVKLVTAFCDRVAVLDWGKVIKVDGPETVWSDPAVRAAYLGVAPGMQAPADTSLLNPDADLAAGAGEAGQA